MFAAVWMKAGAGIACCKASPAPAPKRRFMRLFRPQAGCRPAEIAAVTVLD